MTFRSFLYRLASLLGDFNAAKKGPTAYFKRQIRKQATKGASRTINRWFK